MKTEGRDENSNSADLAHNATLARNPQKTYTEESTKR